MGRILVFLLLGLSGCARGLDYSWDPSGPKTARPFKSWVARLQGLDRSSQADAVERLSWKLRTRSDCQANSRPDPNWDDLVDELSLKGFDELLYVLLSRKRMPPEHFESLGIRFAGDLDERAMRLLELSLSYGGSADHLYRRSAVWALGIYSWTPSFARSLVNRLVPLALEDPDPTTRAFATRALGIGALPESVPILRSALQDRGSVWIPNGSLKDTTVGGWAEQALEMIEKISGAPIPRDSSGQ